MSRFLTIFAFVFAVCPATAQLREGSIVINSDLFANNKDLIPVSEQHFVNIHNRSTGFSLGYFASDNLLIGVGATSGKITYEFLNTGSREKVEYKVTSFNPSIYYVTPSKFGKNSYFYRGVGADMARVKQEGIQEFSNIVGYVKGGLYWCVQKNIALDVSCRLEVYDGQVNMISTTTGGSTRQIQQNTFTGLELNTGLKVLLYTSKAENAAFDGKELFKKGNRATAFSTRVVARRLNLKNGVNTKFEQGVYASYQKEFFVQNNFSLQLGTDFSLTSGLYKWALSLNPNVGMNYYIPLSPRLYLIGAGTAGIGYWTNFNTSTSIKPKRRLNGKLGIGYFLAPNVVVQPSLSFEYSSLGFDPNTFNATMRKNLLTNIQFLYRFNTKEKEKI